MAFIANTKITVNKKQYQKGEVIKGRISSVETRFLLREGYIKESAPDGKKEEKAAVKEEPGAKKKRAGDKAPSGSGDAG